MMIPKGRQRQEQTQRQGRRRNLITSSISTNKLYGRQDEIRRLRLAINCCLDQHKEEEHDEDENEHEHRMTGVPLIFVSGRSGTGKTALIEHVLFHNKNNSSSQMIVGTGKFDIQPDPNPFGVLLRALREIVQRIKNMDLNLKNYYVENISKTFQSTHEQSKLIELMPELADALPHNNTSSSSSSSKSTPAASSTTATKGYNAFNNRDKEDWEQLKYLIRLFLRTISTKERPIVLYFDDLQWSDVGTLEILQSVLLDNQLQNLIFVTSYNSSMIFHDDDNYEKKKVKKVIKNEEDDDRQQKQQPHNNIVAKFINTLKSSTRGKGCIDIEVENLNSIQIEELLYDIFKCEKNDGRNVQELANLVQSRTDGNTFHIMQLLEYLESQRLINYSILKFRWDWDVEAIREKTMVNQDVADILQAKIDLLSKEEVNYLKKCACLGYKFTESVLNVALTGKKIKPLSTITFISSHDGDDEKEEKEKSTMEEYQQKDDSWTVLLESGFLERVGQQQIKFVHDRIYQYAMNLTTNESEKIELHFNIGMALYRHYALLNDNQVLFLCTDRLNSGHLLIKDDIDARLMLCQLNYRASLAAVNFSAFQHALIYAKNGIELLDKSRCWKDNYDLSLGLYSICAEMSFRVGGTDQDVQGPINEIVQKARKLQDCTQAWSTKIKHLLRTSRLEELNASILEIFQTLNISIPVDELIDVEARTTFDKTAAKFSQMTDDDILKLPRIKDSLIGFAIEVVNATFNARSTHIYGPSGRRFVACKMVLLTLEYGLSCTSPLAFSCFSNACLWDPDLLDVKLASRMAGLAMRLCEEFDLKPSPTLCAGTFWEYTWCKPLSFAVDKMIDMYELGMRTGEVSAAFLCIVAYGMAFFYCGLNLDPLVKDMEKFIKQMGDYGQKFNILINISLYQCALNLTSQSEDIFDFSRGSAKTWRDRLEWDGNIGAGSDLSYLMQIATFCRNRKLAVEAKESLLAGETRSDAVVDLYFGLARVFYYGIIAYWQAKKCSKLNVLKRKKLLKEARGYHEMIKSWVFKQGSINLPQKLFIMDAEELSIKKGVSKEELKAAYEKAIVASQKSGFTQDAALAAHLASESIPVERGFYWVQARGYYLKWGATAVVEYVERTKSIRSEEIDKITQQEETGYRARTRFEEIASSPDEHELDGINAVSLRQLSPKRDDSRSNAFAPNLPVPF